ncbi:dnaJ homolog subfamily B member 7 isoform X2 [Manihot esculenta]|uniref:dnaJ homolog subfamily B member 7 isoform X2 n=1 Tax=Manihot esculenta TaxID=3983 RepID=UPI001CC712B1|nr:dnaJ homolog subfamily B member 7 isoform X2 [Manihot esculenta]
MANGEDKSKSKDFYEVLGLNKGCTTSELKNAYKNLALRWHPDRCSASGNSKFVEEAKQNFQAIQQAYSVLSDSNKRFLYDVGAYDNDEDDNENGKTLEDLQDLFEEIFQEDIGSFGGSCQAAASTTTMSSSTSSSYASYSESSSFNYTSTSSVMNFGEFNDVEDSLGFGSHFQKFCLGVEHQQNFKKGKGARGRGIQGGAGGRSRKKHGRKQNIPSSGLDVSSEDHGISTL